MAREKDQQVKRLHPDYKKRSEQWGRCRDAIGGEDDIKNAGERYLPKLSSQSPNEYKSYKLRASFFAATG